MFANTVFATLLSLVASALLVAADPGLSLKVAGPDTVEGVKNLKVVATVTNTGDQTLKLLNDPRGPLSKLPADTFSITDSSGKSPKFTGIKVKYVPDTAAKMDKEDVSTVLAPGQSVDITHDLSTTYNFSSTGQGKYSFDGRNLFHYVDQNSKAVPIYAKTEAHLLSLTGPLSHARALTKRATFNGCSSDEESSLNAAAPAAQSYVSGALDYANGISSGTDRWTTWFGEYSDARHSLIIGHYTNMNGNDYSSYSFDCTCTDSGTYAYVYPDTFGTVYLCGAFWQAPLTGTDSQGGTLVHESSHFTQNAGTGDHVYGQDGCKSLAISDPDSAVDNADSHEYFAENNPAQT